MTRQQRECRALAEPGFVLDRNWALSHQGHVQDALAARPLDGARRVFDDVSSAAFEGRACPLGVLGHTKDEVHGRLQIVYGPLTSKD